MRLAHISDLHLRLYERQDEYNLVIDRLIKSLEEQNPDGIVLAGDLFHNKTVMSPESITMAVGFIIRLMKISNVYAIKGNHDSSGKNNKRMDCLEAVNKLITESNVEDGVFWYYKNSGIYPFRDNINFVVYDFVDKNYPKFHREDGKYYI